METEKKLKLGVKVKLTLMDRVQNASDVFSFIFMPEHPVRWKAGQFMYFTIPHDNADSRGISRYFTISSAPYEKNIMITTRLIRDGGSSFKKALFNLSPGDMLEASNPKGNLVVEDFERSYVLIAGGIGITPFRSIVLDLNHKGKLKNVILLYANSNEEVVFKDEFDKISKENQDFKVHYVISPQHIDSSTIKQNVPDCTNWIYMIAGPMGMVKAIEEILLGIGIDRKDVKKDFFPGY